MKQNKKTTRKRTKELSAFEWKTLVAAWRYYEHGGSIGTATYPDDMVERFFSIDSPYSLESQRKIARQFWYVDHGTRGEEDWKDSVFNECYRTPWCKFFAFCKGFDTGFSSLKLIDGTTEKAFFCETTKRWYPVRFYVKNPRVEQHVAEEGIAEIA